MSWTYKRAFRIGLVVSTFCLPIHAAETEKLFDSHSVLSLALEAPFRTLYSGAEHDVEVDGVLEVEGDTRLPVRLETYGKSRLHLCEVLPLVVSVDPAATNETVFEGLSTLRIVTHCRDDPSLERYMFREYMVYRSYALLTEPALRVRLARIRYEDTGRRGASNTALGFFVEDIGRAAQRHGSTWSRVRALDPGALDAASASFLALFQYLIGNTDFSIIRSVAGERCCHNMAVLRNQANDSLHLLPYDFDQAGLVDAPYAAPAQSLRIKSVTQRNYRGFCLHNGAVPSAVEAFNQRRAKLEALFTDDSLPFPKERASALQYVRGFYRDINNNKSLRKKILARCR